MATEIKVKKIGMSVAPITIVEWKFNESDSIKEGDIILVVETEKIRHDIEARGSGLLHIMVESGNNAEIGSVVGLIAENKEELDALQKEPPPVAKVVEVAEKAQEEAAPVQATGEKIKSAKGERILVSPLARKLAEEHMIDISSISGSGPKGRIVKEDVERAIEAKQATAGVENIYDGKEVQYTVPLTGTRQAIAEHMHRSLQVSAQLTGMGEIDAFQLANFYKSMRNLRESHGLRVTYTDIIVFAVAKSLRDYPMINASIIDNEIKVWKDVNIGVAVDIEGGLIVPVIKNADEKSLFQISDELKALITKAKSRKLTGDDVKGGTFTVSNIGALGFGWRFDTLIINQPESAILGIGGISDRPAVRDGQVVVRPIMTYSFTYDHRLVDGSSAAGFISKFITLLEDPFSLLVPLDK